MKKMSVSLVVQIMAIVILTGLLPYGVPAAEAFGIGLSEPVLATTNEDSVISFPDSIFEAAVREAIDKPAGDILKSDVEAVTYLNVGYKYIKSLSGIEYFTNLETLYCNNNQLTELDVSNNTKLTLLYCNRNQLEVLDVSKNTALIYLSCEVNQLAELDVSKNTELTSIICGANLLKELDISNNTKLKYLYCDMNQLTVLDVSNNMELEYLICRYNNIPSEAAIIGLNKSISTSFGFYPQNIPTIPPTSENFVISFPDSNFEAAVREVIGKPEGDIIRSDIEGVTYLDVSNKGIKYLSGIEYFTGLEVLYCYNNQLAKLDVSGCTALTDLNVSNNQFEKLYVSGNQLAKLDVSNNTKLIYLDCSYNQLTELNLSGCTALTDLGCRYNQLTELDVSKNTALTDLYCNYNQLAELDVSACTALTELSCEYNQLTELDVSNNTKLTHLDFSGNQLTELDISKNTALTDLECYDNQLTELDVSKNTALTDLGCRYNQLTELDVSGCTALTNLDCRNNQLAELNVSGCTALTVLECDNNNLTELNVNNTKLRHLYCRYNNIPSEANIIGLNKSTLLVFHFDPQNIPTENVISFPDSNFEAAVREVIDKPEGDIYKSDVEAITYLYVSSKDIESLSGIEYFTNLKTLNCHGNKLTELDVSENTALTYFDCSDNNLTELDVSNNTKLIYLYCHYNKIPSEANIIGLNKSVTTYFDFYPQLTADSGHTDSVVVNYTNSLVLQSGVISGGVQVNVENNTNSVKSSVIVLAIYDASGELVYSKSNTRSLAAGVSVNPVHFSGISISGANAESYIVKVMCWNSFLDMEPLAPHEAFVLNSN